MSAIPSLVCIYRLLHHGLRKWLYRLPAGHVERFDLPLLVHDDRCLPSPFRWLEDLEKNEVVDARGSGPVEGCRGD